MVCESWMKSGKCASNLDFYLVACTKKWEPSLMIKGLQVVPKKSWNVLIITIMLILC